MSKFILPAFCELCEAKMPWLLVDSTNEEEIYECELCNNYIMFRYEAVDKDDN
jgi:hypothetical protein